MRTEGEVTLNIAGELVSHPTNVILSNTYSDNRENRLYSAAINLTLTETEYHSFINAIIEARSPKIGESK